MNTKLLFGIFLNCAFAYSGQDYYSQCMDGTNGHVSFINTKECQPDTLYSWQEHHSIRWKKFDKNPPVHGTLCTWRTPIGTFGYGDVQLRIKLDPETQFIIITPEERDCSVLRQKHRSEKIVYVAFLHWWQNKTVTDFILCTNNAVESWSAHTPESYEEAKREAEYVKDHYFDVPQSFDSYITYYGRYNHNKSPVIGMAKYPFGDNNGDEGTVWTQDVFYRRLNGLAKNPYPNMGKVFGRNITDHFKTNVKLYY